MAYGKSQGSFLVALIWGVLILLYTGQSIAGEIIEPVLKGKDPLPDALKGHGIESLDTYENIPVQEKITNNNRIQGWLLQALGVDDVDRARYLISRGAKVNQAFSNGGSTPLMLTQSLAMAQLLVDQGADVNARDPDSGTALHYAVTRPGARELISFLVKSGADINARGWNGETPLTLLVAYLNENRSKDMGIIHLLIKLGADINAPDGNGYTGLMQAAGTGNNSLADLLLSLGADKTLTDPYGKTARDMAYESGARYIYQRLE